MNINKAAHARNMGMAVGVSYKRPRPTPERNAAVIPMIGLRKQFVDPEYDVYRVHLESVFVSGCGHTFLRHQVERTMPADFQRIDKGVSDELLGLSGGFSHYLTLGQISCKS